MSPSWDPSDLEVSAPSSTEAKANIKSSSALTSAKQNLQYLWKPNSPNVLHPTGLRTRALLRSLRFIGIFVFWRVVRYAKYALVGSVVAAIGASAFGGVISGAAFVLAPPTLFTSVGIGLIWAMGKWGFRKMHVRERIGHTAERQVSERRERMKKDGQWRDVQGGEVIPW
ncbi:hypothetical protein BJ878DRAFT_521183 [Calycina marina]|uniref:Transmembrane protein n=1 Tax=Calycina marina TaxID=1763456 RepID=A0A9P7YY27_9HELO|nr:hypothetical protein BJ878DRAFT_521183 [Calycina marina]